jgi:radical SAM superfamily enzyme YgiQ (UPF0313 family)
MVAKIVLTADETMMSMYQGGMFVGFSTCMPTGIMPDWLYFTLFSPPVPRRDGRALYADLGLRMLEASLLANGFTDEEVAVVHPRDLEKMIGSETRIVGIGVHDPLGLNPPTSEFVDLVRMGPPYNRVKFSELIRKPVMKKVITMVGGKGAWQLADEDKMDKLGIDYVHLGEGEVSVPEVFKKILNGEELPRIIRGEDVPPEKIPCLRSPTIHGVVEIMRGCGRGCKFCTPTMQRLRHRSIRHILRDIKTNLRAGQNPLLLGEDILRYGTVGVVPEREKVRDLFEKVVSIGGIKKISTSHVALASVYHQPKVLEDISEILSSLGQKWIGTQTGIETGSPRLVEKYMPGKPLPSPPENWPEIVRHSLGLLEDNGWVPACTLIYGFPDEREEDLLKTLELLDDIKCYKALIVPLNFVSMGGSSLSKADSFTVEKMKREHWMILGECLEHDIKVARELKGAYVSGNLFKRWLFKVITDRLIKKLERYAVIMKKGQPPKDYTNDKDYFRPKI